VVIQVLGIFGTVHTTLHQKTHQLPCHLHVSLETLPQTAETSFHRLGVLPQNRFVVVLEIGKHYFEGPVDLVGFQGPQRPGFFVGVKEVDEVHDLQYDLCDLKVIQDHIVLLHLFEGSVVEVKDEVVGVSFYFFIQGHPSRNLPVFTSEISVLDGDPIETYQVRTVVSLQLFDIHQEGLQFVDRDVLVFVEQEGTIVDAGLEHLIAPQVVVHRVQLVEDLNVIVRANDVLLDLLRKVLNVLVARSLDEFVDNRRILFLLALFEEDNAVVLPVLLYQSTVHFFEDTGRGHAFLLIIDDVSCEKEFDLLYLSLYFLRGNEL
jgi:hypothetical protein